MRIIHFYALILLAALMQGCSKDDNVRVRDNNILPSVITDNFNLKTFRAALDRSNLTDAVSADGLLHRAGIRPTRLSPRAATTALPLLSPPASPR